MNSAAIQPSPNKDTIVWAIICSLLLHGLLALIIPNIDLDDIKEPELLEITLAPKTEPQAQPEPVQSEPEVTKPKIEPKLKPEPKPVIKNKPSPIVQETQPVVETPVITPPQEVIAVKPVAERPTPVQTIPINEPVKEPPPPPAPSQAEIDNATGRYGNALWSAISKHKKYPKIAQMRGWQGETIIELELDGTGKLKSKKVVQSSGYEVLDKQALEMVEKALPFPTPPEALRNSNFTITVPVPFKLE
ncbi:MAG: energy transducer TonB [Methylotenera sp.]|uniref:energy transducer TonB n=1 Tax=Methylotenera sp. TaxID=2051956 RepID=UPI000D445C6A|nr:energy transducer TonB [Methylotenera sp.]PPC82230.1 MAG: energy transducer TonB [Methylotenera sp.]